MDRPLPSELRDKWGTLRFIRYTSGEWHSECPVCRDDGHVGNDPPDRFTMFPASGGKSARGWCRQCGHFEWADDDYGKPPDPKKLLLTQQLRRQYARKERQRLKEKINWLQQQTFWIDWHEQMTKAERELWRKEGIGDWAIEVHKLGFRRDYHLQDNDIPALTIPYLWGDKIQSLQFRLLDPDVNGKYRFLSELSPTWFKPWPTEPVKDHILVVEGAKKAIVTMQHGGLVRYQGHEVSIIGTSSKMVPQNMIDVLKKRNPKLVIWMLDPDAFETTTTFAGQVSTSAISRNVSAFGPEKSLVVRLPDKIDDLWTHYGLDFATFEAMVNQAGPLGGV